MAQGFHIKHFALAGYSRQRLLLHSSRCTALACSSPMAPQQSKQAALFQPRFLQRRGQRSRIQRQCRFTFNLSR